MHGDDARGSTVTMTMMGVAEDATPSQVQRVHGR